MRAVGRQAPPVRAGPGRAGVVADVRYVDNVNTFNGSTSGCADTAPNRGTGASCQAIYNAFTTERPVAIAAFATAGVLGVASAILFSTGYGGTASHALACGALGRGGSCGFVF